MTAPARAWGIAQANAKPKFREKAPVVDFVQKRQEAQQAKEAFERARAVAQRYRAAEENEQIKRDKIERLRRLMQIARIGRSSAENILQTVNDAAAEHKVSFQDIMGDSRKRHIVQARHDAIRRVKAAFPHLSLPSMGKVFGLDHTTVMYVLKGGR